MIINGKAAASALVKARAAIGATVTKDARANYGRYATLAAVMEAITPALAANGLALVQEAELDDATVTVAATLIHESGETIEFAPLAMPLGNQRTPQAVGSALTYNRRYQLTALFGLAPDDDDGEAASQRHGQAASQPAKATQTAQERTNGRNMTTDARAPYKTQQRPSAPATAHIDDAPPVSQDGPDENPFHDDSIGASAEAAPRGVPVAEKTLKRLHILGNQFYGSKAEWDAKRPGLVEYVSQGAVTSSADLTENEARKLCANLEAKIAQAQQPDAALRRQVA